MENIVIQSDLPKVLDIDSVDLTQLPKRLRIILEDLERDDAEAIAQFQSDI